MKKSKKIITSIILVVLIYISYCTLVYFNPKLNIANIKARKLNEKLDENIMFKYEEFEFAKHSYADVIKFVDYVYIDGKIYGTYVTLPFEATKEFKDSLSKYKKVSLKSPSYIFPFLIDGLTTIKDPKGYAYKINENEIVVENNNKYIRLEYLEGYEFTTGIKLIEDLKLDKYTKVYKIEDGLITSKSAMYKDIVEVDKSKYENLLQKVKEYKYDRNHRASGDKALIHEYIIEKENDKRMLLYRPNDDSFALGSVYTALINKE